MAATEIKDTVHTGLWNEVFDWLEMEKTLLNKFFGHCLHLARWHVSILADAAFPTQKPKNTRTTLFKET